MNINVIKLKSLVSTPTKLNYNKENIKIYYSDCFNKMLMN